MGDRGTGKSTTVRALVDHLQWMWLQMILSTHPSDPELMVKKFEKFKLVKH
jgi:Mg-chelatase subunit ChlI